MARKYYVEAASSPGMLPSPPHGPAHAHHSNRPIWGGLAVGILIVLFAALLYYLLRRKLLTALRKKSPWKVKGSLKDEKLIMLRRFQLEELVKATNSFSQECLLGSGGFGNVYKGTFDVEGILAIKRAHNDSYQSLEEFRNEVKLLSKVKHRNLVGLVGFCEEPGAKGSKMLVYEYVANGSLLEYITGRRGRNINWRQRVIIAIGAAKGIAHLHDGITPSIIHRDIKPSNILVGDGFKAKVSDFGLVKSGPTGDQSHVSSQIKGTPGYLDPAYCSSFHLTTFSDVYSFGVILLQLVTARPAIEKNRIHSNYHVIEWARPSLERGRVEEILDANLLSEPCNMEMMLKMGQLGLKCVVKIPKQRPTMTQVWQELEAALYSAENFINKYPSWDSRTSNAATRRASVDCDCSQSFVSINGIGFQRFHVDMDSMSFQSTSLRCLENNSISIEIDKNNLRGICEEKSIEEEPLSTS
ncbi:hypothetical protein FNV43_RR18634 [Rhamnella rubrinervis]|uniref:Protein kinase domain-containing protein n=1 Tax=Rhamnella rubrinervis TaxID=2594499 RepID=A0A8K0GY37_9ROSA|nr:hypothetical protein FNV43_RR18634 [Rhamnella rubrinervis]